MSTSGDNDVPQWKKDLIARLRSQNRRQQQLCAGPPHSASVAVECAAQQPVFASVAFASSNGKSERAATGKCDECPASSPKMVQERAWNWEPVEAEACRNNNGDYRKNSDSDSSEDLHYGPGIVNRLKNKYLSLALRESNARARASILPMRKAASLENILDDIPNGARAPGGDRLFQRSNDTGKNAPNRYRNAARGTELKRARSVETISSSQEEHHDNDLKPKRESLHEEMLIAPGSDKPYKIILDGKMLETTQEPKQYAQRINRPKRLTPVMNEKEKPPADFVKHAKLIFERRPEQRTRQPQHTGEVAAKVATYKNIIVQAKANKKPPIKHKPPVSDNKPKTVRTPPKPSPKSSPKTIDKIEKEEAKDTAPPTPAALPSPIPDVSRIDFTRAENERGTKNTSLSETPDLILTSSPISPVRLPSFRIAATEDFIEEERRHSAATIRPTTRSPQLSPVKTKTSSPELAPPPKPASTNSEGAPSTITFNFLNTAKNQNHLPANKNVSNTKTPPTQPLKLEINGIGNLESKKAILSPLLRQAATGVHHERCKILSPPPPVRKLPKTPADIILSPPVLVVQERKEVVVLSPTKGAAPSIKPALTILEIEKNLINTAKTLEQPKSGVIVKSTVEEVIKIQVPKVKKPPREPENNSIVFKFTDRKDVPDYVHNDGLTRVGKIEKPKVGEGGIILLPGASIGESFTDEDDEIMRSLEAPPSPCDVTFENDNILIDGKSSLSQKTKKAKMSISFVEAGPEIYEYPSESSLLIEIEDVATSPLNAQMGHTVPSLAGTSSLANYTPKSTEEFQPGVTRSVHAVATKPEIPEDLPVDQTLLQELEQPILFSAGTNSDILF